MADSPQQIEDAFGCELQFGTGGLRGVIGAGTNRMNLYTVRKATQGLADYLNASGLPKKVAIAHASRHNGALFARETARVLAANGITACMYPRLEPTPALSWAVRYLGCGAGVCVTASHNPAKYNGYKVYGADGCQITLEAAEKILAAIEKIDCFDGVKLTDYDAALADGSIVTGKTSSLLGASSACLLNALKALAGIDKKLPLIAPGVIEPIQHLKVEHLGNHNPRLHTDELLIALSICAVTNPMAGYAIDQLGKLRGCEAHSSVILSHVDEDLFKKLGVNITFEPKYQAKKLFHKN